tara:strand:- start:14 stop:601 length:588 start_codon:yes stop_codon:yes gene_type:complete
MKKWLALFLVVGGVAVGMGISNFSDRWKSSPEYSLMQIKEALDTSDWYLFEKHVDLETLTEGALDVVADNALIDLGPMPRGLLELAKPAVVATVKNQVEKYVEGGAFLEEPSEEDEEGLLPFDFDLEPLVGAGEILSTASMKYLEEEDTEATLGLEFVDPDGEAHVMEIRLRKHEDYWRVTEILNLGDIWYQLAL